MNSQKSNCRLVTSQQNINIIDWKALKMGFHGTQCRVVAFLTNEVVHFQHLIYRSHDTLINTYEVPFVTLDSAFVDHPVLVSINTPLVSLCNAPLSPCWDQEEHFEAGNLSAPISLLLNWAVDTLMASFTKLWLILD